MKLDLDSKEVQYLDTYNCKIRKDARTIKTTINSSNEDYIYQNYRIRKLTPKECFRLMGVKDEDFEKIRVRQTESSLYHLAGDSIVVNVLMAIFKEAL